MRFGLCLAKHNEQHLPVLSFSNAPQAKKRFGCCVFCKQRNKNKAQGKNAQATQGKHGSWRNLRVHARHFHVSMYPLSVRN